MGLPPSWMGFRHVRLTVKPLITCECAVDEIEQRPQRWQRHQRHQTTPTKTHVAKDAPTAATTTTTATTAPPTRDTDNEASADWLTVCCATDGACSGQTRSRSPCAPVNSGIKGTTGQLWHKNARASILDLSHVPSPRGRAAPAAQWCCRAPATSPKRPPAAPPAAATSPALSGIAPRGVPSAASSRAGLWLARYGHTTRSNDWTQLSERTARSVGRTRCQPVWTNKMTRGW